MMNKKIWSTLFSIQILDTTKKASDAWDVALVPTDECVQKLKRYKMFFKKLKNGGVIIFENDGQRKPIATEKAECFTFYLRLLNSALGSNLDVNRAIFNDNSSLTINGSGVFYFDNLDNSGKILRGGTVSIFQKNNALTEVDKALLIGTDSTISLKEDLKVKLIKRGIEAEVEKDITSFDVKKDTTQPLNFNKLTKDGQTQAFVNLPDALYALSWDGANPQSLNIFKSDKLIAEKPFGIIEIFENKNLILKKITHYTLELTRQTTWRYMITQDKTTVISNLGFAVSAGGTVLDFDKFDNSSLETADNHLELDIIRRFEQRYDASAIIFRSKDKLPIDNKPFAEPLLTWKKDSKNIKHILATPNTESSAVFITYKIGS